MDSAFKVNRIITEIIQSALPITFSSTGAVDMSLIYIIACSIRVHLPSFGFRLVTNSLLFIAP
jgi:hypothetical protein|uniref:Uncharacterized protein n=1 Tax=Picea glauca TaxID=3330 RepID=A0A117NGR7_PICGL|nr:hypothetical protein ABT39_MTgene6214 [Picea glauca]QHR88737.1 hypothetical protein Q903MT_gene2751 [Picea sitchensis]